MERETQEIENRNKRKRDKSRDRQDFSKLAKNEERSEGEEDSGEADSGDEDDDSDDDDETESGEDSGDTASEQSGATPEHNDGREENEGEEVEGEENETDASDTDSGSEKDQRLKSTKSTKDQDDSDQSRSPSKSPTPRRASDEDDISPQSGTENNETEQMNMEQHEPEMAPIQHDIRDDLPPYLPSIFGCRSVEEFQCLNRIEEGTYGVVYRAKNKKTDEIVALKKLKMEREKEGFPITSLREINTLLISQHQNVVHVREIVVGSNMDKIFIVMDFVEHDLKSLMETMRKKKQVFLAGEVK